MSWRAEGQPPEAESADPEAPPRAPSELIRRPEAGYAPWAELHCHSAFSFLDGVAAPGELVAEAARLGLETLAITDHDGMYGVPQFAQAAARLEQHGARLRTVFGAELSLGLPPGGNGGAGSPPVRGGSRGVVRPD
jgi:error-prone DNA polymerase